MGKNKDITQTDFYWETRTLCSDESCIGVINSEGYCKECGKKFEGELPEFGAPAEVETSAEKPQPEETKAQEPAAGIAVSTSQDSGDSKLESYWKNRMLCSDESCIGVIGPDGRCRECGKPFKNGQ